MAAHLAPADAGTRLSREDVWPAVVGGMLLSAGGSGMERAVRDRRFGELALESGTLALAPVASIAEGADVIVATGVGAPGQGGHLPNPEHSVLAARQLIAASGAKPAGVIPGHVPGLYAWVMSAALGVPLLDAACNGRGHPTVKMGSLGLASKPEVTFFQSGVGDKVRITVHGNTLTTSALMRAASVQNGGLIMACRGPLPASLVRDAGAVGAITFQLALGRAMLEAGASASAVIDALARMLDARVLADGVVAGNTVSYREGFDVGEVTVKGGDGEVALGVCNEYMTASRDGTRLATFPDLMATLDPDTGTVLAIRELQPGRPVIALACSKRKLPLGPGIFDPAVYPDVEAAMGVELARYALDASA